MQARYTNEVDHRLENPVTLHDHRPPTPSFVTRPDSIHAPYIRPQGVRAEGEHQCAPTKTTATGRKSSGRATGDIV